MNQSQPKSRTPQALLIVGGIVVMICILCSVGSFAMQAMGLIPSPTASPLPTTTPIPSNTPLPASPTATLPPTVTLAPLDELSADIENTLGAGNRDIPRLTDFIWSENEKGIVVNWAINDNFSKDLIMIGIQTDITDVLKVISQSGLLPNYEFVNFAGTFPLRDAFGNTSEEIVVTALYNKSTIDKINWEGFQYTDIFVIADQYHIHQAMTKP